MRRSAVVFVVSAAAHADRIRLRAARRRRRDTDAVVGVVSKIDVHRGWRDVVAANRDVLAAHAPRYGQVPWVGAAALPDLGEPTRRRPGRDRRSDNSPIPISRGETGCGRGNSGSRTARERFDRDADGAGRRARVDALREERSGVLRERRQSKTERTITLRSQIQQARVQLSYFARNRCSSVRTELQEDAAGLSRRNMPGFEAYARGRVDEVVAEVNEGTTTHLADVAEVMGVPVDPAGRRASCRRLTSRRRR